MAARQADTQTPPASVPSSDGAGLFSALGTATDGVVIIDASATASPRGAVLWCNAAFCRQVDHKTPIGNSVTSVWWPDERRVPARHRLRQCLKARTCFTQEIRRHNEAAKTFKVLECQLTPMTLDGRPTFLGIQRDVTARVRATERLARLAFHDALTDLPNRTLFMERLERTLLDSQTTGASVAVGYIDLNGFKTINDTHGHAVGDALLKATAERLQRVLRSADTVARLGGDEFALVLPAISDATALQSIAEKVLSVTSAPVDAGGHRIEPRISLGLALGPEDGTSAMQLVERADTAMLLSKRSGEHGWQRWASMPTDDTELALVRKVVSHLDDHLSIRCLRQARSDTSRTYLVDVDWPVLQFSDERHDARIRNQLLALGLGPVLLQRLAAARPAHCDRWLLPLTSLGDLATLHEMTPTGLGVRLTEAMVARADSRELAALNQLHDAGWILVLEDLSLTELSLSRLRDLPIELVLLAQEITTDSSTARSIATLAGSVGHAVGMFLWPDEGQTRASEINVDWVVESSAVLPTPSKRE
ncbi:MAG: diguanylate cyclase domain-containing protein [Myxococcota bacterium]